MDFGIFLMSDFKCRKHIKMIEDVSKSGPDCLLMLTYILSITASARVKRVKMFFGPVPELQQGQLAPIRLT